MNSIADNPVARFGAFIRTRRLSLNLTARAVAEAAELKPSNFCNLELGIVKPPQAPDKLKKLASALKLEIGTEHFSLFADLAAKANTTVPVDIADIVTADDAVPLLLRSLGNKKLTKGDVASIVELVRKKRQ